MRFYAVQWLLHRSAGIELNSGDATPAIMRTDVDDDVNRHVQQPFDYVELQSGAFDEALTISAN